MSTHHDSGVQETLGTDVIIWATGFRPSRTDFRAPIADRLEREGDEFRIDDSFAVRWDGPPGRQIFVLNGARNQRGLADPNLSLLAWRSQRVIERLNGTGHQCPDPLPSFVSWAPNPAPATTSDGRSGERGTRCTGSGIRTRLRGRSDL